MKEVLTVEAASAMLADFVSKDYVWPEMMAGWQIEFIAHENGVVEMDFLHPVSGSFWSDDNDFLITPKKPDGSDIDVWTLIKAGVPYMTTFKNASAGGLKKEPHLKVV